MENRALSAFREKEYRVADHKMSRGVAVPVAFRGNSGRDSEKEMIFMDFVAM